MTSHNRHHARARDDRGSVSAELAVGIPMTVLLALLLTGAYQLASAGLDVNTAAAAAARAATLTHTPHAAVGAARDSVRANLGQRCTPLAVDVDTTKFHRGGTVTVQVGCTVTTRGLLGVSLPGHVTVTAQSTSPLDQYRAAR